MVTACKIGDLVILKSGGPVMTVADVADLVMTQWFVSEEVRTDRFDDNQLIVVATVGATNDRPVSEV